MRPNFRGSHVPKLRLNRRSLWGWLVQEKVAICDVWRNTKPYESCRLRRSLTFSARTETLVRVENVVSSEHEKFLIRCGPANARHADRSMLLFVERFLIGQLRRGE